jgi:hypothetical protein
MIKHKYITGNIFLILILVMTILTPSLAQEKIRIRKDIVVDTVAIWINYPSNFDIQKRQTYDQIMKEVIKKANSDFSYFTQLDPAGSKYNLSIDMDTISYTTGKQSRNATLFNLLFFGGHAAMIGVFGWTLPVLITYIPETKSDTNIYVDKNLTDKSTHIQSIIASGGYFTSRNKQDVRFERRFGKYIYKLGKGIDKQNKKNNR